MKKLSASDCSCIPYSDELFQKYTERSKTKISFIKENLFDKQRPF